MIDWLMMMTNITKSNTLSNELLDYWKRYGNVKQLYGNVKQIRILFEVQVAIGYLLRDGYLGKIVPSNGYRTFRRTG